MIPAPALVIALVIVGLVGVAVGSLVNVVVTRVPAQVPVAGGVRPRLVPLATGIAFVGVVAWLLGSDLPGLGAADVGAASGWVAASLVLIAFLYLAAVSVALVLIDLDVHRLPDVIVLPSYVVGVVLLGAASLIEGDVAAVVRMLIGGAVLYLFYALLRLIQPGGMGGGDVKLAGVLGIHLGWVGWPALVIGGCAAFLFGGVFGVVLLVFRRATGKTRIPFGPWMIAGAWIGVIAGPALTAWYSGLTALTA
ncbi:A24 family peptidase [Microbacterium sp. KR10-403]|uniref:prepilin peptidase n=1 Tax=Microbacterium sp. KR10-403 TaxID=3158581 RepID=UPI0032E3906C